MTSLVYDDYLGRADIRWMWTKHGKLLSEQESAQLNGYEVSDWFHHGPLAIEQASMAATADGADHILAEAYLGDSENGVGLRWQIFFYPVGRLS